MAVRPSPGRAGPGLPFLAPAIAFAIVLACGCAAISPHRALSSVTAPQGPALTPASLARVQELIDQGEYRVADSLATAMRAAAETRGGVDSLALADLLDLASEATWRSGDRRSSRAIDAASLALAVRERRLGPDHVDVAKSLIALANVQYGDGQVATAESTLRRALALREAHLPAEDTLVASAAFQLGRVVYERGNAVEGKILQERALAIREKVLGPEHRDVAASLYGLAMLLNSQGDYAGARSAIERSIEITERRFGPQHPFLGKRLRTLSWILRSTGKFDEAIPVAERVLAIQSAALGPDHVEVGYALLELADCYGWGGHYREALPLHERALAILEKALGHDNLALAWPVGGIGDLYHALGDEARGREMLERALALLEKNLPPLHPDIALSLDRLGEFYVETGEYDRARPLLERALAIRRQILPAGHVDLPTSLDRLARCYWGLGDLPRARALMEEAAPIFEHTEGPISPAGWGYSIEAELACMDGAYERAVSLYGRALDLLRNNGPGGVSGVECGLGLANMMLNRLDAAERFFCAADTHSTEAQGPRHCSRAIPLTGLAEVRLRLGRPQDAFEVARQAAEIERVEARHNLRLLPEEHGLRVAATRHQGLDMMLGIVSRRARDARLDSIAFDAVVRSRAMVLDEVGARHHPPGESGDTAVAALAARYAAASRRLASLEVRGPGGQSTDLYRDVVNDARRERDEAEQALARRSAAFRSEQAMWEAGARAVAAALGEGQALVSIARFETEWTEHPMMPVTPASRVGAHPGYLAFVLRHRERTPALVPLGDAARIDRLVAAWRQAANRGDGCRTEAAYRAAGLALERAVWDPIALHLAGATQVFVVPDGSLQFVNWATMPVGRDRYLVERGPLISYLSAERDLVEPASSARGSGLLAIGAPDFDADPSSALLASATTAAPARGDHYRGPHSECAAFHTVRFDTLPAARLELGDVAAAWRAQRAARFSTASDRIEFAASGGDRAPGPASDRPPSSSGPAIELTGRDATESAFVEHAPGKRVIHIATHAFFTGAECNSRPGERGIGAMIPVAIGAPAPQEENPLLLSGLVFAGANHRDRVAPGDDDGILTAEEIAALDLSGVEWAVLSGCETGVGEESPGEGVLGLRRAFQLAGVRTLITSLWAVQDRATREWMSELYRARLERGMSAAASVRQACIETLRTRRARHRSTHPSTWGAFVCVGDWR